MGGHPRDSTERRWQQPAEKRQAISAYPAKPTDPPPAGTQSPARNSHQLRSLIPQHGEIISDAFLRPCSRPPAGTAEGPEVKTAKNLTNEGDWVYIPSKLDLGLPVHSL